MGSTCWDPRRLRFKFHKDLSWFGRDIIIYRALEGLQRVPEGADRTEMARISGIIQLGSQKLKFKFA